MDLYGEPRLVELLHELEKVDGIEWIRLMYLYPMYFSDELIDTIALSKRIVPYLDLPLQHASDSMLKRMQRRVNRRDTLTLLEKLRTRIPNLAMRTTLITGFPGETDADFAELVDFVREQKFERLGVFTYSLEPDTPAARLTGHVPDEVKNDRRDRLMAEQQTLAFAWGDRQIGRQLDVLIDTPVAGEKHAWIGRTWADAPDVDCVAYVTGAGLRPGDFARCEVVARKEYDLIAASVG
jgi:ribosomal protein S12 methylthiotransferase